MNKWRTRDIIRLFGDLYCSLEVCQQGGDVDTERIVLIANEAKPVIGYRPQISISGFVTSGDIMSPSDTEIEMIEVTDGEDSREGLNTSDLATCVLYGQVVSILRKAGFVVVPQMKDYF